MYIYVRGEVFLSNGMKDLHLSKVEVTDFDSFTDEKAEAVLDKLKNIFLEKSEGDYCVVETISQHEYASLCGPMFPMIP